MIVNVKILAGNRRLGKKGEEIQLDSTFAEKYRKCGLVEIITNTTEVSDGDVDAGSNPGDTGPEDAEG